MPTADESTQERESYGNAPGWSASTRETKETPQAALEASPAPDAEADSSPAPVEETSQEQVTEQAPPQQATPEAQDVPFNKHPRWIERQRELEEARQRAERAEQLAQLALQRPQVVQPQVPMKDVWAGKVDNPDPGVAQFWQEQRAMLQQAMYAAKQEALQEIAPVIDAGRQEIARLNAKEFRKENPEIAPGSADEQQIIAYMEGRVDGVRHPIESAKRNALYDRLETENRALKTKQTAIPQKRAANTERSAGIPNTAGLPPKPGDWRQRVSDVLDNGGDIRDAANAIWGRRR